MGKVTDIHDALVDLVETTLGATYTRIPNPYLVMENAHTFLTKGFGIGVGSGVRLDLGTCQASYQRTYQIILTNLVYSTVNNVDTREAIDLSILEDFQALFLALERDPHIGGTVFRSTVESDTGIEFADSEALKFIMMTIDVTVEYQEQY